VIAPADDANPNEVPCLACGTVLFVPDEHLGKRGRCYACGAVIEAGPAPADVEAPTPLAEPELVPVSVAPEPVPDVELVEPSFAADDPPAEIPGPDAATATFVEPDPEVAEAVSELVPSEPGPMAREVGAEAMAAGGLPEEVVEESAELGSAEADAAADVPELLDRSAPAPTPPPPNRPTTALGLWAVLLERQIDAAVHKDALAQAMKLTPADAAHRIREGQGVLSTLLTDELAEEVLAALELGGVPARAVLADQLVPLPPALRVRKLTWSPSGLVAHPDGGLASIAVPWDALRVIHCGRVAEPALRARSISPAPPAYSPIGRVARGAAALASVESAGIRGSTADGGDLVADLVALEPAVRLRLDTRYLDFSALGPSRESTAPPNLRLTLREVLSRCPRITSNLGRQELDAQGPFEPPRYEGHDLFERRTMWMLNLALSREAEDN